MSTPSLIALIVLVLALLILGLLTRARALGPLTSAGFVLGSLATGAGFVLFG